MFQGIEPIAQIIIAITILFISLTISIIAFKRGIKIGAKSLSLGGDNSGTLHINDLDLIIDMIVENVEAFFELNRYVKLERKMAYAQTKLMKIRGLKEQRFYKLLKNAGVKQDALTSHPDAQYYIQVLGNAIYYDNGTQSLMSALRSALRKNEYSYVPELTDNQNRERFEKNIKSFTEATMQRWKRFFYDSYKTDVVDDDCNPRKRKVTNEDIYDSDFEKQHLDEIYKIFIEIFDNARLIDGQIEKEQTELEAKRKEKIQQIINLRSKE